MTALFLWGGIVAVRPSPAQKRIAGLRQKAMEKGMRVRLGSQLKLGVQADLSRIIAYLLHRPKTLKNSSGTILLRSGTGEDNRATGIFTRPDGRLEQILDSLPKGCSLVASSGTEVMIGWDERGGESEVEAISEALQQLMEWTNKN